MSLEADTNSHEYMQYFDFWRLTEFKGGVDISLPPPPHNGMHLS